MKWFRLFLILSCVVMGCSDNGSQVLVRPDASDDGDDGEGDPIKPEEKPDKPEEKPVETKKCVEDELSCSGDVLMKCVSEKEQKSPKSGCSDNFWIYCSDGELQKAACSHCDFVGGVAKCLDCTDDLDCDTGVCQSGECQIATDEPCKDACMSGEKKCEGGASYICDDTDGDGCLNWSDPVACTGETVCIGGICQQEKVPDSCSDDCPVMGAFECIGNGYHKCVNIDEDSCLEWSETVACQSDEVCVAGMCVQTTDPKPSCTDECQANAKECLSDKTYRVCGSFDDDTCLEWSGVQNCLTTQTCEGGACKSVTQSCNDDCSNGQRQCSGNSAYQTCGFFDDDICLDWSAPQNCAANEKCSGGNCVQNCQNACNSGQKQCSGATGYQSCELKSDGCYGWGDVVKCGSGTACTGSGNCTKSCTDACTDNKKTCSGTEGYKVCEQKSSGCYDWSEVTKCGSGKECRDGSCVTTTVNEPVRYLADRIHSPITSYVVSKMQAISAKNANRKSNRFMKIGDSHMAITSEFVKCFSTDSKITLDSHTNISSAISSFKNGFDCYSRDSITAVGGKDTYYSYGSYNGGTRLSSEISAVNPRFAFFGHGTNDMGNGGYTKKKNGDYAGYSYAMQIYYQRVLRTARDLMSDGIIPLFIGVGVRTDSPKNIAYLSGAPAISADGKPADYVTTFNAIQRGVAEAYQFPYMNLQKVYQAIGSSNNYGLWSDGIHAASAGSACDFTSSSLSKYGMNNRNLYSMEMLNRAWGALYNGGSVPDSTGETFKGSGSPTDPWIVSSLPFTHSANTKNSPHSKISTYSCDTTANEGGPEYYYKMVLNAKTKIRAFVVSDSGADLDIHIKNSATDNQCIDRDDIWFEKTLNAGTYYFVIDTFVKNNTAQSGEYLFGVHACDADDPYCG
ncbi:MAG: SGNH/GDSL hydrolase family protein [Proteobacteria bacterium]|nr:SGNH/GDSL hydrolase family protein [Pseudomonadota bacterium]